MIRPRGLRRQILLSFVGFAAAASVLFAIASFVVAYVVEDRLFAQGLQEEVSRQQTQWRVTGRLAQPAREYVSVHASPATFPADLRAAFLSDGPSSEVRGSQGRHYHVRSFTVGAGRRAYLVAEVGGRLAVRSLRGELIFLLASIAIGFLIAAAALGFWLANRATRPLGLLADAVAAVPSGEVPQIKAADFPDDEVGVLARALEISLSRVSGFVEREIRFTRDASHELRTPLAIVRTSAELMEARTLPQGLERPLRRIVEASKDMERTIDLLLLLAREERAASVPTATALLPIVEKVVLEESERFKADAFRVSIDIQADITTDLDAAVAATIAGNLVGNVFRHSQGSTLRVFAEGRDLVIADEGPGLPAGAKATLLSDDGTQTSSLGLSIVARLCRLHGVAVRVERKAGETLVRLSLISA